MFDPVLPVRVIGLSYEYMEPTAQPGHGLSGTAANAAAPQHRARTAPATNASAELGRAMVRANSQVISLLEALLAAPQPQPGSPPPAGPVRPSSSTSSPGQLADAISAFGPPPHDAVASGSARPPAPPVEVSRDDEPGSDDAFVEPPGEVGCVTTLMVRNIPTSLSQDLLLELWPIDGTYDLMYLPRHAKGNSHSGYAFMNFTSAAFAAEFLQSWQKRRMVHGGVSKRLNIIPAEVQGFEANVRQMKKKRVARIALETSFAPVILVQGQRVELNDL